MSPEMFAEVHKCPDCDWHPDLGYIEATPLGAWWVWEFSRHRQQAHPWYGPKPTPPAA